MAENVVDIKIKAKVDTKELQAEMKQIAETSKTSIEQSYKNLEVTMRKSVEALGGDLEKVGRNVSFDAFLDSFKSQMQQLNEEIRQTGNLPLGMTSKIFDAEQAVESLINRYYQLYDAISEFSDTEKYVESDKYKQMSNDILELNSRYNTAASTVDRLTQELDALKQREQLLSQVEGGQRTLDNYNRQLEKIKELEDEVRRLKELQGANIAQGRYMGLSGKELEENRQQIAAIEEQITNARKSLNFFGSENITILEKIRDLEAQISEETLKSGNKNKLSEDIENAKQKLADLAVQISEAKAKRKELEESGGKYTISQEFNNATKEVERLEVEIVKAASRLNELQKNAQKSGDSFGHLRAQIRAFERVLAGVYTVSRDAVTAAKQIANIYKQIWNAAKKVLSVFKQMRDKIRGTASEHAKSWKMMLRDIIRYSLGIRSLFALFRRLRKYIKEAFEAMAEQIPEVNAMLSNLKSSFGMLKGSLATAFEPILSALAPALERLINLLSTAITYIGMFWAALTGRGYVYKATKAIQNVAGAAKEMNKQLQGFDELNNLTSDNGGGAGNPLANFEKVDVADWIKDLVDKIKDIARQIFDPIKKAWDLVGDYVIGSWKHTITSIKDLLTDIGRDFLRAWAERAEQIFINIFNIVGDIGNAIGYIADALREAWNYNENGYRIWLAILDIVERITYWMSEISLDFAQWTRDLDVTPAMTAFREWLESLVPVADAVGRIMYDFWHDTIKPILNWTFNSENSGIARLFNIFRDFNKKIDWNKLRDNLDKIWQALGRFGETVGEGLLLFIQGLADELANWINSDDFANTCDKIVEFFDNIDKYEIAEDLNKVLDTIKNIAEWVWKAIKLVIDNKDAILNTLQFISEHLGTIVGLIVGFKLALDSIRLGADVVRLLTFFKEPESSFSGFSKLIGIIPGSFGELSEALGKVVGIIGSIPGPVLIAVAVIGTLVAAFIHLYNTSEEFREKVSKAMEEVRAAFANFKKDMQPFVEQFKTAFASLKESLKPVLDAIMKFLEAILSGLLATLGPIVSAIGNVITIITYAITAFLSLLTGDFTGFFTNLGRGVKATVDLVKNIILTFISFGEGAFSTFSKTIASVFTNMKNTVIRIFESMKSGVHNVVNSILSIIESFCNGIINGVNRAISAINSIPSINIPSMGRISIPKLAQGAVIPPNNEFLAVLGDQKKGTNIESPLSTMVEAFNMANKGGSEQELALLQEQNDLLRQLLDKEFGISGDDIFRSVRNSARTYKKSTGNSAFA